MFVVWYLVLALWALVACSKPLVLPVVVNDPAERADQSSHGATASPQSDLVLVLSESLQPEQGTDVQGSSPQPYVPLRRAAIPSVPEHNVYPIGSPPPSMTGPLIINTIPPLPIYISFFPVIAYSTLLAIIGFISVRIARWRNRRRAGQDRVDIDGVELLPTNTVALSPRFRDLPVPPPLPHTASHPPPKSASVTSLNSFSLVSRPSSPPLVPPWPQNRLNREFERPKSPLQHLGFSPGAKIKRRSNSLDLGQRKRNPQHGLAPTPLRRPFFISEPEPEHDRLPHDHRYRDDDDAETTLIHFSPSHQRPKSHGHSLRYSTSNTPLPPLPQSHQTEDKTLVDYSSSSSSSSLSLDKVRMTSSPKHEALSGPMVLPHAAVWAFDINAPQTSTPPLPPAHLSSSQMKNVSSSSSDEINLIDFSPKMKEKLLIEIEGGSLHPDGELLHPAPSSETSRETEKGYEGGDEEDEMDIAWGGGWGWEFAPSVPVTPKAGQSFDANHNDVVPEEDDMVDTKSPSTAVGVIMGQPLSAVSTPSSSSLAAPSPAELDKEKVKNNEGLAVFEEREQETHVFHQDAEPKSLVDVEQVVREKDERQPSPSPVQQPANSDTMVAEIPDLVLEERDETIHDHYERNDFDDIDLQKLPKFESRNEGTVLILDAKLSVADEVTELAGYPPLPLSPTVSKPSAPPEEADKSSISDSLPSRPEVLLEAAEVENGDPDVDNADTKDATTEKEVAQEMEEFPDPDLLPLPTVPVRVETPQLDTASRSPSPVSSSASSPMQQTPTPPASPPNGNVVLPAFSRSTSLANITNRPAWSVRAADMPPLGIHATNGLVSKSGDAGNAKRNDENWDVVKRRKAKEKEREVLQVKEAEEQADNVQTKDGAEEEVQTVETMAEQISGFDSLPKVSSPIVSVASLPGSFPVDATVAETKPTPSTPAGVDSKPEPMASASGFLAVTKSAARTGRRTATRSPIDIALAMQLRPGLGIGADPAWMVRFLMAMFGWFVVLISGSTGSEYGYAGAYVGVRRRG
ncbi:hypothetical protein Moror_6610 [Moniliophthora roreri MCA 2997]|uniref:Transmembrane protein n=2 Tax=Moniliophthora roreri TaxID=221103 RepID=V2YYP3_MONRO|nr:hypothetical protein Moror_6610 [Moniliophthora roreri MCA 2997]